MINSVMSKIEQSHVLVFCFILSKLSIVDGWAIQNNLKYFPIGNCNLRMCDVWFEFRIGRQSKAG